MPDIQQDGDAIVLVASSPTANVALPAKSNGALPRRILVVAEGGAVGTGAIVKLGDATVAVTLTDGIAIYAGGSQILYCGGQARIAALRKTGSDVDVHIVPLSD